MCDERKEKGDQEAYAQLPRFLAILIGVAISVEPFIYRSRSDFAQKKRGVDVAQTKGVQSNSG